MAALGNSADVQPGARRMIVNWNAANEDQQLVRQQCGPYCQKLSSWGASLMTAHLYTEVLEVVTELASEDAPYWVVTWSSDGVGTMDAEIDAGRGKWVVVTASEINVEIVNPEGSGVVVKATAMIGRGSHAPPGITGVPTRSMFVQVPPDHAGSTALTIPKFAVSVVQANTDPAIPILTFEQSDALHVLSSAPLGKRDSDSIPIVNGAMTFSMDEPGGSAVRSKAIFYLAL